MKWVTTVNGPSITLHVWFFCKNPAIECLQLKPSWFFSIMKFMCSCITEHKILPFLFQGCCISEIFSAIVQHLSFKAFNPSMYRWNWPGWCVAGWWWRTSSTLILAASSELVTTQRISPDDCAVSQMSTWLPSAVFWITTLTSHSTHAALLCSTRRLCGWISFAQAAWRPLIWIKCLRYDKFLNYCWDFMIVQTWNSVHPLMKFRLFCN